MNMRQRAPNIFREWAVFFGLLILLNVVLFLGWVLLEPAATRSVALIVLLMILYLVAFAIILLIFYRRVGRAHSPPEYREAREHGLPATAKVLEIQRTRWRVEPNISFSLKLRPRRWEYEIRLRVSRPGEADYEGMVAEFMRADQLPKQGATIPVKVHPQRPEVIVLVHEETSDLR